MSDDEISHITILLDHLKNDDHNQRLNSIRNLDTIGEALGVERTIEELLPYLTEIIEEGDDEDEIYLAYAEMLGNFVHRCGGIQSAHHLLPPLENLCLVEEANVREKAIESLSAIGNEFSADQHEKYFIPMIKRLAGGDWYSARISACGLVVIPYDKVNDTIQQELKSTFKELGEDDTPMVRRAAAKNIGTFALKVENDYFRSILLPLFENLARDQQDSVRLYCLDNATKIAKLLTMEEFREELLPIVVTCAKDPRAWRVRFAVADHIASFAEEVDDPQSRQEFMEVMLILFKDTEAEVRSSAVCNLPKFSLCYDKQEIIEKIIPQFSVLSQDTSQHVKGAFVEILCKMAEILGEDDSITHIVPTVMHMMNKDEILEVRVSLLENLGMINTVLGSENCINHIVPLLKEYSEDKQWRVKLSIVQVIPQIAELVSESEFETHLSPIILNLMTDSVFSVRKTTLEIFLELASKFGNQWLQTRLIEKFRDMSNHTNCTFRLAVLLNLFECITKFSPDAIRNDIHPTLLKLSHDPVPNIQFNVAKLIMQHHYVLDHDLLTSELIPRLREMRDSMDSDDDVRYFSMRCLDICDPSS